METTKTDTRRDTKLRLDPKLHQFLRMEAARLDVTMLDYMALLMTREQTNTQFLTMDEICALHNAAKKKGA